MGHQIRLLHAGFVTHDVRQFIASRPDGFRYEPGQGVELSIDQEAWKDEGRPFTPTSLEDGPVLEFTIKGYPERDGVTRRFHSLRPGARLLMSEPFGTITWRGAGTFVAAGAGVTPFLAMLRQPGNADALSECSLLFSNRTPADVIAEKELRHLLGSRCHLTCTERSAPGYDSRRIDRSWLEEKVGRFDQPFYVCGPEEFVRDISGALKELGVDPDRVVVEE